MNTYDNQIEQKVLDLLQWDSEKHNELVFETGIAYLRCMTSEYPQVTRQISNTKLFWNWWRSHWQDRDRQFLEECETWVTTLEKYRLVYENHNHARTLAEALYLNGQVLQDSYAQLMGDLINNQKEVEA